MKLTKDQIVYFFESTGDYAGKIQKGRITEATKDIYTGSISYLVEYQDIEYSFIVPSNNYIKLTQNQLYTSLKKIQKDYVDYLIYGTWLAKVQKIEKLLNEVVEHYSEKIAFEGGLTLASGTITSAWEGSAWKGNIIVDGIGDIAEEINKLKADVEKIKKKIKKPSKKPVIKEGKKQE